MHERNLFTSTTTQRVRSARLEDPAAIGWLTAITAASSASVTAAVVASGVGVAVAEVAIVVGAAALAGSAVTVFGARRLGSSLATARSRALEAETRLWEQEARNHEDRSRMHEVRSTVAGIRAARDLAHNHSLDVAAGDQLEASINSELDRLSRLVSESEGPESVRPAASAPRIPTQRSPQESSTSLDVTLSALVDTHRARGRAVEWHPTGDKVGAPSDDVSAIVNILLENAARHAPGSRIRISVVPTQEAVVVTVSDDGPGVPEHLRGHLFEFGVRDPASPGEGIGLHMAADLARRHGGTLALHSPAAGGAAFSAHFPAVTSGEERSAHVRAR